MKKVSSFRSSSSSQSARHVYAGRRSLNSAKVSGARATHSVVIRAHSFENQPEPGDDYTKSETPVAGLSPEQQAFLERKKARERGEQPEPAPNSGPCQTCGGTGMVACGACGGTGKNPSQGATVDFNEGARLQSPTNMVDTAGDKMCWVCRGQKYLACYDCAGSGTNIGKWLGMGD
ncbi:hypothetical protein NFJ02_31g79320 [Pycnococcus provasolii]